MDVEEYRNRGHYGIIILILSSWPKAMVNILLGSILCMASQQLLDS